MAAGQIAFFCSSEDPSVLEADGYTVHRLSTVEPNLAIDVAIDVALISSDLAGAEQLIEALRRHSPEVALVSLMTPNRETPLAGIDDAIHWPPRPHEKRLIHWMTESARNARNTHLLAEQGPLAELGKLVTQVVHEIRSPLTALSAKLQWLKHKAKDLPELAHISAKLDDEVTRLARLSTDVIEMGRSRQGKPGSSEVWSTLQEVLTLYRETCERSGIVLKVHGSAEQSRVPISSEELHQVFQNLLTNAIDATPPEQEIDIDVHPEGHLLAVEFRNPGHLTDDTIAHAFDLFYTTKRNGSGLGLPIVKRILTGRKGDIVALNDGANVVVKVKMPLLRA